MEDRHGGGRRRGGGDEVEDGVEDEEECGQQYTVEDNAVTNDQNGMCNLIEYS